MSAITQADEFIPIADYATTAQILEELVQSMSASEWNSCVNMIRSVDPEWRADLKGASLKDAPLQGKDFSRADLRLANLRNANMLECNLTDALLDQADLYFTNLSHADVTGSTYRNAVCWESAETWNTIGFIKPLPDVTEQVARCFLREAIEDPTSIVNAGLEDLRAGNINFRWRGSDLEFWIVSEIEKVESPCETGDCECEIDHACHGDCDCCSCYRGECDCEPDHEYSPYNTGDIYLSTVIGRVAYEWSDHCGFVGKIQLSRDSIHPHVSTDGTACWGSAQMPRSLRAADYILMILGWIAQHNPASEYRDIDDLPHIH